MKSVYAGTVLFKSNFAGPSVCSVSCSQLTHQIDMDSQSNVETIQHYLLIASNFSVDDSEF